LAEYGDHHKEARVAIMLTLSEPRIIEREPYLVVGA